MDSFEWTQILLQKHALEVLAMPRNDSYVLSRG